MTINLLSKNGMSPSFLHNRSVQWGMTQRRRVFTRIYSSVTIVCVCLFMNREWGRVMAGGYAPAQLALSLTQSVLCAALMPLQSLSHTHTRRGVYSPFTLLLECWTWRSGLLGLLGRTSIARMLMMCTWKYMNLRDKTIIYFFFPLKPSFQSFLNSVTKFTWLTSLLRRKLSQSCVETIQVVMLQNLSGNYANVVMQQWLPKFLAAKPNEWNCSAVWSHICQWWMERIVAMVTKLYSGRWECTFRLVTNMSYDQFANWLATLSKSQCWLICIFICIRILGFSSEEKNNNKSNFTRKCPDYKQIPCAYVTMKTGANVY